MDARLQLAAEALLADNFEVTLEELLIMHQQDPEFEQSRAQPGMLTISGLLGDSNNLAQAYRQKIL